MMLDINIIPCSFDSLKDWINFEQAKQFSSAPLIEINFNLSASTFQKTNWEKWYLWRTD